MQMPERARLLRETFERRILVLDGAMGTMIQARNLGAEDFGGAQYEGCNEHLNLTRPDVIRAIHEAYLEAGADLVSTNSFGCAPYVLGEYGLHADCHEIALAAARLAREAALRHSTPGRPRFTIGAMGPGTRSITVTGNVSFDQVREGYYHQARALIEGGVDALLLETAQDTLNLKAAAIGVKRALAEAGLDLPLVVSGTIEPMGSMLAGQGVDALYASLEHLRLFAIGLNCATGPEFMTDHLRTLSDIATCFVTVYPNAGLPDEHGHYEETAESLAMKMRRFVDQGWVNLVGGCCGTTPAHIRALARLVEGRPPRRPAPARAPAVSGIEALYPGDDNRPVIVGERTNVIGSRKFKELIVEDKFEEAAELGRAQVRSGGQVLDVCLANPDRDEAADMERCMAVTTERKLAIAERSWHLLTERYGLPARDLIFDALVFPVGTGDANYVGSAMATIEGVRAIKTRFPECKTILGISNVSFGLPPAGREVLNSVFLYHCTKAGLDYAIVNSEKLERYASIPEDERRLAEDLIYWRGDDPVAAFAAHFRGKTRKARVEGARLSLDERLARYIVEGSKDGLIEDLDRKLAEAGALDIVNGPLMKGMEEVGRLFNDNQLIVAEVLQSAEAMKAAVGHLEGFMEKDESASRGTIVLATVKGDVHDIGKNLVEIILKNNGYRIVNLGIKVPPEDLIAAYHTHKPDAFGLSGLLVKSAPQMVVTAQDLRAACIEVPLFVGGAALTKKFTAMRIAAEYGGATLYAKDAMDGLDLANQLFSPLTRDALLERIRGEQAALTAPAGGGDAGPAASARPGPLRSTVSRTVPVPPPPDLELHVLRNVPLGRIYPYLNLQMLLGKHMGVKGSVLRLLSAGDAKAREVNDALEELKREVAEQSLMRADGLYRFYRAGAAGDEIGR